MGGRSDTVFGPDSGEFGAGVVTVSDNNVNDCDGDGAPGDFDGDYEAGVGGAFFGDGPWANEATCNFGLKDHGNVATVNDVVWGSNVAFVTGADDTTGPDLTPDPVTGEPACTTDGSITPCGDDPADPTCDPDDCLSDTFVGSGPACGAGGDGGWWVFLSGAFVDEAGGPICLPLPPEVVDPPICVGDVGASNAPTAGTITA